MNVTTSKTEHLTRVTPKSPNTFFHILSYKVINLSVSFSLSFPHFLSPQTPSFPDTRCLCYSVRIFLVILSKFCPFSPEVFIQSFRFSFSFSLFTRSCFRAWFLDPL